MDRLGNIVTGDKWSFAKIIFESLFEANSNLITTFLRKRQGVQMFSFGKMFWVSCWMFFAVLIFQESLNHHIANGTEEGHYYSLFLLWWHGTLFTWLFIIKWIIAYLSIGSKNQRWFRYRDSIGDSIIWPLVYWILRPLKLSVDQEKPRFWQLSERRWMLIAEPALLIWLSHWLYEAGYTAYSNFIFWASLAFIFTTWRAAKNTDMDEQLLRETENMPLGR